MASNTDGRASHNSITFGRNSKISIGQFSVGDNNTLTSTTYQFADIDNEQALALVIARFARFLHACPSVAAEVPALLSASPDLVAQFVALAQAYIASAETAPADLASELRRTCKALGIADRWLEDD